MRVSDVMAILDQWAPLAYSEDFDNTGLLVGDASAEVRGIIVTLDTLEEVVDEAIAQKCNLIVSFHPIIFSGLKKITPQDYTTRSVRKAIKNDIAIFAIHTALDNAIFGVSATMAQALGLRNSRILMPKENVLTKLVTYIPQDSVAEVRDALFAAGGGAIGHYDHCNFEVLGTGRFRPTDQAQPAIGHIGQNHSGPEVQMSITFMAHLKTPVMDALKLAHPYEEVAYDLTNLPQTCSEIGMGMVGDLAQPMTPNAFMDLVKNAFNCGVIKYSKEYQNQIQRVAVLGGSGSFAIDRAKASKADCYLTADLKYHDFFKGEKDFLLADIGHYESEQHTKALIVNYLSKKITNFAPSLPPCKVVLSKVNTNPISYYS